MMQVSLVNDGPVTIMLDSVDSRRAPAATPATSSSPSAGTEDKAGVSSAPVGAGEA
eukprot:EC716020.1.p2 GENE.EC716020.1~~EC716020.1.p2  ORF type:complete len:56 (+),score=10.78 EC716020.1:19-186(+)